jgi:hypothetical protein
MEAGPPGTDCRISPQTTGRCVGMRSQVVSSPGKGGARLRQVWIRKTNESEPLMRRRKVPNVIETRPLWRPWDEARKGPVYGPGGDRRIGGVSLIQAFMWNMGTWRPDTTIRREANRTAWPVGSWPPEGRGPKARVKGDTQGEATSRVRVPKRDAGADQLVVAVKPGNSGRAKGLDRLASGVGQPERGGANA